jgi:hypothetical protein
MLYFEQRNIHQKLPPLQQDTAGKHKAMDAAGNRLNQILQA